MHLAHVTSPVILRSRHDSGPAAPDLSGSSTAGAPRSAPAAYVEIWFGADVESGLPSEGDPGNGYPKIGDIGDTPFTHPQYDPNAFNLFDLGVVEITTWRVPEVDTFGVLPAQDELDKLAPKRGKKDLTFTAIGYGIQKSFPSAADWKIQTATVGTEAGAAHVDPDRSGMCDLALATRVTGSNGWRDLSPGWRREPRIARGQPRPVPDLTSGWFSA